MKAQEVPTHSCITARTRLLRIEGEQTATQLSKREAQEAQEM